MSGKFDGFFVFCLTLSTCVGCGGASSVNEDADTLNIVRGSAVMVDGKEIPEGVIVTFHPKAEPVPGQQIVGQYTADENFYTVTTITGTEKKSGAPVGTYTVTFQAPKNKPGSIPAKYSNPATSDVTVEVKAGTNVFPELKLAP